MFPGARFRFDPDRVADTSTTTSNCCIIDDRGNELVIHGLNGTQGYDYDGWADVVEDE